MERIRLVAGIAVVAGALTASSAQASTVTVGSPLTAVPNGSVSCGSCTYTNTALDEPSAHATSPVSGTVVLWRVMENAGGAAFKLRVLRPAGGGQYTGVGTSTAQVPTGTGPSSFATSLPIQAGDLIGLDLPSGPSWNGLLGPATGSIITVWNPILADGSTRSPFTSIPDEEAGFNADVQPNQPAISSISPTAGPFTGGTGVTIKGNGFTGATGVNFGSMPAASFTVNSDSQITAVSPRSSKLGAVDLGASVFGVNSASVPADKFTYLGCLVPRLKGKKLKRARRALRNRDCALGKVKGPRNGRIKRQNPKPGTVIATGSKVRVKLG